VNCLCLQHLLRGIKWAQGPALPRRLPITVDHLMVIQRSLDLSTRDHVMLWAACCLGFFGFLLAGEFTVNSIIDPNTHMTVSDLHADSLVNPSCFKVCIRCSKTDPFRMGCDVYLGCGLGAVCHITALGSYLSLHGSAPGLLFMFSNGCPLTRQQLPSSVQSILNEARYSGSYSGHSFCIGAVTTAGSSRSPYQDLRTLI